MAAEAATVAQSHKRRRLNISPRSGFNETRRNQLSDLQQAMYQALVKTGQRVNDPSKFNIGEIPLGSERGERGFNTHDYNGKRIKFLERVDSLDSVDPSVPYIARGMMDFIEEGNEVAAVLQTATMDLNLGPISPEAQSLLEDTLAGHEIVAPVVFKETEDGEKYVQVGETVAYLIPNPNWLTRQRLRRHEAHGVLEGQVASVDPQETNKMTLLTKVGKFFSRDRKTDISIGTNHPVLGPGTKDDPTGGEPVGVRDRVRAPVQFRKEGVMVTGDLGLVGFSEPHKKSFEKGRRGLEQGLDLFDDLLRNDELQEVTTPDKRRFDVSTPEKKAAVMRYLFAELNRKWNLLTETQQGRLWDNMLAMDQSGRSFIFDEGDPMREVLDNYFQKIDPKDFVPRLSEAMTPEQLLQEIFYMTSFDSSPPPLANLIDLIDRYPTQFPKDVSKELIRSVFYTRIKHLQGESESDAAPEATINSLIEVVPYFKEEKNEYRAKWLAELIDTCTDLYAKDPDKWANSRALSHLMRQSVDDVITAVYSEGEYQYMETDYEALFALVSNPNIGEWPFSLPYGLGVHEGLKRIIRDIDFYDAFSRRRSPDFALPQEDLSAEQPGPVPPEDDSQLQAAVDA